MVAQWWDMTTFLQLGFRQMKWWCNDGRTTVQNCLRNRSSVSELFPKIVVFPPKSSHFNRVSSWRLESRPVRPALIRLVSHWMKVSRICWRCSAGIWKKLAAAWFEMKFKVLSVRALSSASSTYGFSSRSWCRVWA